MNPDLRWKLQQVRDLGDTSAGNAMDSDKLGLIVNMVGSEELLKPLFEKDQTRRFEFCLIFELWIKTLKPEA